MRPTDAPAAEGRAPRTPFAEGRKSHGRAPRRHASAFRLLLALAFASRGQRTHHAPVTQKAKGDWVYDGSRVRVSGSVADQGLANVTQLLSPRCN